MSDARPEMTVEKPAVRILSAGDVDPRALSCIGWGLEEEGIPFTREKVPDDSLNSLNSLAARAARESRLHVGIGVSGRMRQAALHHSDQPVEKAILIAAIEPHTPDELFRLGKNAARLVKGNPFCLEAEPMASESEPGSHTQCRPVAVEQIISAIVAELLNQHNKRKA